MHTRLRRRLLTGSARAYLLILAAVSAHAAGAAWHAACGCGCARAGRLRDAEHDDPKADRRLVVVLHGSGGTLAVVQGTALRSL